MHRVSAILNTIAEWVSLCFFAVMGGVFLIALVYGVAWFLLI